MPNEMSAVWRVLHTFQTCGMKAVVVSVAAALPAQSVILMRGVLEEGLSHWAAIIALRDVCTTLAIARSIAFVLPDDTKNADCVVGSK